MDYVYIEEKEAVLQLAQINCGGWLPYHQNKLSSRKKK